METHHITPARGLSETGLKWIALVTMVLDHIHYFFSFTGCVPEWFSMVGRLGAPLFLFCLVEGFTHTHSRKRYFARVYVLSTAMSSLLLLMAFAVFYFLYGVVYMGLMASQMPDFAWTQLFTRYYEIYGILAAPLMLCYNGQRGGGHKRLFYAFYPAHIYILYALSWGLYLLLN